MRGDGALISFRLDSGQVSFRRIYTETNDEGKSS